MHMSRARVGQAQQLAGFERLIAVEAGHRIGGAGAVGEKRLAPIVSVQACSGKILGFSAGATSQNLYQIALPAQGPPSGACTG